VVDVEVTRIVKEKQSISAAFDGAEVVRDEGSNDAEDTQRVEV
jgi:hypothetical protein